MWSYVQTTVYLGHDKFFRMRLLTLDTQGIEEYVKQLDDEVLNIKDNAIQLTWVMRGGVQYIDVLNMSSAERKMIANLSKENLETTKKSGLPYF